MNHTIDMFKFLNWRTEMAIDFSESIGKEFTVTLDNSDKADIDFFEHPVAHKTEWTPLKKVFSTRRQTHTLDVSENSAEYKPTLPTIIAAIMPAFWCIFTCILYIEPSSRAYMISKSSVLTATLVPLVSIIVTIGYEYIVFVPRVFDKTKGLFFQGFGFRKKRIEDINCSKRCALSDIAAVQFLKKTIIRKRGMYDSYETNIVLNSGARYFIIDSGDIGTAFEDAEELAKFLAVPLWDTLD